MSGPTGRATAAFDVRLRAAARALDRPDLTAEWTRYLDLEDAHRARTAGLIGESDLDAAAATAAEPATGRPGARHPRAGRPDPWDPPRPVADPGDPDDPENLDDLAVAAAAGSRRARAELARALWPRLMRYCRCRLGHGWDRDAAVAEAIDTVLRALPHLAQRPILPVAYAAAARAVTARLRRVPAPAHPPPGSVPGESEGRALLAALGDLPRVQRDVLVLRVLLGRSADETAERLGTTPGAVRVAQHRALVRLRARPEPTGGG